MNNPDTKEVNVRLVVLTIGITAVYLLAGCGGGGGLSDSGAVHNLKVDPGAGKVASFGNVTLTVPSGAFPQGGQLTVVIKEKSPDWPNNPSFQQVTDEVKIRSDVTPSAPLILEFNTEPNRATLKGVYLTVSRAAKGNFLIQSYELASDATKLGIKLTKELLNDAGEWIITNGYLVFSEPDPRLELVNIAGGGTLSEGSVILVHGINSNIERVRQLGKELVEKRLYKNAYALSYDWRNLTPAVGRYLASELKKLNVNKGIDLIGHSKGTLIIRYALEIEEATKPVKRALLVNGPHLGSKWANAVATINGLWENFINEPLTFNPARWQEPCISELATNSQLIRELNDTSRYKQRGVVDYILVASNALPDLGKEDGVVLEESAHCRGVPLEQFTAGKIDTKTLSFLNVTSYVHSTPFSTSKGREELIKILRQEPAEDLQAWVDPNPSEYNHQTHKWHQSLYIKNGSSRLLVVRNIAMELYDKDGQWWSTQWYDPNTLPGECFPKHLAVLDHQLMPGESYPAIHFAVGPVITDGSKRVNTILITITYHDSSGRSKQKEVRVQLIKDGEFPGNPKTRSRGQPENSQAVIRLGSQN